MTSECESTPTSLPAESEPSQKDFSWDEYFIEVAVRAIRGLHFQYQRWTFGQPWRRDNRSTPQRLNIGEGIELAYETDVCAAITQEFVSSCFTSGVRPKKDNNADEGRRYWEIRREEKYTYEKPDKNNNFVTSRERIDLVVQRVTDNKSTEGEAHKEIWIEAKRAHRYTPDLTTGDVNRKEDNFSLINDDIAALRAEQDHRDKNNSNTNIIPYVLMWGIYLEQRDNNPDAVPDNILSMLTPRQIVWFPTSWSPPSSNSLRLDHPPLVNRWCWVALYQVNNKIDD